ncbi:MAG: amidase [Acidimicrobiales bacterium]
MPELHDLNALEQAAAIRRRQVSPRELVAHYLARVDRYSEAVGAFVTVTAAQALEEAGRAEARLKEVGPEGAASLPPLLAVPTAVKDLNLTAGVPTKFGSAALADFVAPADDYVVSRLKEAGLISLGKTNTPELGLTCYTEPDVAPPARSPFDLSRSAGGSSGGAGAAVAAGLVPVAQGSDGAGSVRIPASVCGLVGLKPSRGRVSGGPAGADVTGLVVNGPIARTVADAAAMLDALAGPMPGDPYWAPPLPAGGSFLDASRQPVGRLRVGVLRDPVISSAEVSATCLAALDDAAALLEGLGHEAEACEAPFDEAIVATFETIWTVGAAAAPVPDSREGELRALTRWFRERGRAVSGPRLFEALAAAQLAARRAVVLFSRYDAVLTPALAQPPAPVGAFRDDDHPERDFEAQKCFTPFTVVANITGQPAISLPLYWTAAGLPIGVQLIGRPAGEAPLLALAGQLEQARPWRHHVPSMW